MNTLEKPTYIPGTYKGADMEKPSEEATENAENEEYITSIMTSLESKDSQYELIHGTIGADSQTVIPAVVNSHTGEIDKFITRENKKDAIGSDFSKIFFIHITGNVKENTPDHIKGFRLPQEGISETAFENLKEAIERLKEEKGAKRK